MTFISGLAVVIIATVVSTWVNDHVYKGEYLSDDA
jgi:hypothetical protein